MAELKAGLGRVPLAIPCWEETTDGTPLVARCLILDDGATRLAILSVCVIALARPEANTVRQAVSQATGIPLSNTMVACTHVHSGPPSFAGDAETRREIAGHVARACRTAALEAAKTRPARLGYETSRLGGVSRVRRILRRDGSVVSLRRAWPQYWDWATNPETVGPEEPLDDLLTVLRIEDEGGEVMGAIMHFTCHPIPDFFGYAARLVEANVPGAVCLVLNGCSGSVDTPFEIPMRGKTQAEQLPILGDILGYRALELLARAETSDELVVGAASRPVSLPIDSRAGEAGERNSDVWDEAIRAGVFETEVQCLRIGDLALAGIPGEAQVGFAATVAQASPFTLTRSVGLANDECGYLLTEEARARGSYEADPGTWGVVTGVGLTRILNAIRECLAELE